MRIELIGDIALNGLISEDIDKNETRFSIIQEYLKADDLIFANLETPAGEGIGFIENKQLHISCSPEVLKKMLQKFNICCLSLANNHILDYKKPGLKSTIDILDSIGIFHTGAGCEGEERHIEPVLVTKGGVKVAFLAYVDLSTHPGYKANEGLLLNIFQIDKAKIEINKIRNDADLVIFSIHWGVDYSHYPTVNQMKISKELIDAGADIIMGHHSHTAQPFELYKGKYIFYGLGSLTYGDDFWNSELRALRKKTKFSFIPVIEFKEGALKLLTGIETRELKGNYLKLGNRNYIKWSGRKMRELRLADKCFIARHLLSWKEFYFDKYFDYLFGYYRNPLRVLLRPMNYKRLFIKLLGKNI